MKAFFLFLFSLFSLSFDERYEADAIRLSTHITSVAHRNVALSKKNGASLTQMNEMQVIRNSPWSWVVGQHQQVETRHIFQ